LEVGRARIFIYPDTDDHARKRRWTDDLLAKAVDDVERWLNDGPLRRERWKSTQ